MGNTLRTIGLFGLMMLLFIVVGWLVGGLFYGSPMVGMGFFLAIAAVLNVVSYFWSHKIVLWSHDAEIVDETQAPRLHRIIRELSHDAGIPMPQVAITPSNTPNAFATGRNPENAVVAATQGILQLLDDDELRGVMAHELAHVQNRDILVMSAAATLAGAIAFAARSAMWGAIFGGGRDRGNLVTIMLLAVTAPMAAMLVQAAISRNREFKADATGARLSNDPMSLSRALRKLEAGIDRRPDQDGNPAHSHLYIANPFRGGTMVRLFSTHPPMDERVERLQQMAREMGQAF